MSIFESSILGTTTNRITFNNDAGDPYYRVTRRAPTRRELREFDVPLPEETGDADYQSFIGKTYFIIEGTMYPDDEDSFHDGRRALRKVASLEIQQDDASSDDGYVPYTYPGLNGTRRIDVKVMYVDIPESTRIGLKQPFRLLCKIKYPVEFSENAVTGSLVIGSGSSHTGGATIPAIIPMTIGSSSSGTTSLPFILPVVLGASPGGGSISLINTGDLSTYPSFTIQGPISRPRIVNATTGEYLELDVILGTSDSAIIQYDQDSLNVTANNSTATARLTNGSTLFKIRPGQNIFTLSGASVGTGARASVTFRSAWPLS